MSYRYPNGWDYTWMAVLILVTIAVIGWISFGIWHASNQPYRPLDPREEFVKSCEAQEHNDTWGVPDVHTSNWVCTYPRD
jgi:hypothetical protein